VDNIKPRLVVSRCLGFDACRWNGVTIPSELMELIRPHAEIITVCPELEIGLGVPRNPVRVIGIKEEDRKLYQPETGRYFTQEMRDFTQTFFKGLPVIDGFVLKSKSPSCGIKDVKIYPREGKVALAAQDKGFFGGPVLSAFPCSAIEDDARLTNFRIREHFLTKLFCISRFRWLKENVSMRGIVEFHTRHKLIFMAYNQKQMRVLGRIVANLERKPISELLKEYETHLLLVFTNISRYTSHINVLMHALGYVSRKISSGERAFFLQLLEDYRHAHVPLSVPLGVMKSHLVRFQEKYLLDQYYFNPFPSELVQITDSGKGRTLKS
jgi:uncharacterized protein YbgA (DUF1722 family)/uncharacterized protein YbbK (DUF523 family)